jgi:ubiquitin carboxyl-terminal hydrolase 4/11
MDGDHVQENLDRMDIDLASSAVSGINGTRASGHHLNDIGSTVSSGTTPPSLLGSSDVAPDSSSSATQVDIDDEETIASLDAQVEMVRAQAFESPQTEAMPGYAVSMAWLARVISRSKFNVEMGPFDKSSLEGEIGPVDNSAILATGEFK